jgi:hypothetical protein
MAKIRKLNCMCLSSLLIALSLEVIILVLLLKHEHRVFAKMSPGLRQELGLSRDNTSDEDKNGPVIFLHEGIGM